MASRIMPEAYITSHLENEQRIKRLRNDLWGVVDMSSHYMKVDPHITVIPPFRYPEGVEDDIRDMTEDSPLVGRDVDVHRIGVYKNIHKPFVVLLDVSVDMEDEREKLYEELLQLSEGKIPEPVRPHITLFKTKGWWSDIDEQTKKVIQNEIRYRTTLRDTKITEVKPIFKD